jgi:predicted dehydrogenase
MENKENQKGSGVETRRDFIKKTATAAAIVTGANIFKTPVYGQSTAPSTGRVIGANDRILVGYIGVGGQGMAHVRSQKENAAENNIAQVAVCDVSKTRIGDAQKYIGGEVKGYEDHRRLVENKDIDAVVVSTVDHWHAPCSIAAMEMGKHVYCEKPMTRYLDEAFQVHDAVKKTGRVFQVGSQICSDARWHEAAKMIKAGKIGPLVMGQDSYMRNSPKGEWNYKIMDWCTPEDVDWKTWLGPKIKKKVDAQNWDLAKDHYFRWRKYYPYCAGLLGDLFPHRLHPFMLATGNPEFPRRVTSIGTKPVHSDKNSPGTPERDVPENVGLMAEFPSGYMLLMTSSTINEQGLTSMIRGHHGTLYLGGSSVELKPERPFGDEVEPEKLEGLKPSGEKISEMEKNWFHCIRTGETPFANIDLAIRVQTVISLAEMSERLNTMCLFDEKTRKITTGDGKSITPISYGTLELS